MYIGFKIFLLTIVINSSLHAFTLENAPSPFILDLEYAGACGEEGGKELPNDVVNQMISSSHELNLFNYSNETKAHYFFLSLRDYLADPKKQAQEYRFFKNKDFTKTPDLILDSNGLRDREGNSLCKWRITYNDERVFQNSLICDSFTFPIEYKDLTPIGGSVYLCAVVKVNEYEVDNEIFSYRIRINNEVYYLDTTNMPKLISGESFYSREMRALVEQKYRLKENQKVLDYLAVFKKSSIYQELVRCNSSRDEECLLKFYKHEFYFNVAKDFCYDGSCGDVEESDNLCGDYSKYESQIKNSMVNKISKVINEISSMSIQNYYIVDEELIIKTGSKNAIDEEIVIDIKDGKFLFVKIRNRSIC